MKFKFPQRIFKKSSCIKFHQNPSNGSRVVPHRRMNRQTDMTKLIIAFHNFANVPKNVKFQQTKKSTLVQLAELKTTTATKKWCSIKKSCISRKFNFQVLTMPWAQLWNCFFLGVLWPSMMHWSLNSTYWPREMGSKLIVPLYAFTAAYCVQASFMWRIKLRLQWYV